AIPYFASPMVGRSVHTLSALFGLMLVAFGLLWPRLRLGAAPSRIAFWFLVYSGLAITATFFLAATWGAGQSVMPLSGAPRGSAGGARRSGGCHHGGVVLVCADGHHRVRAALGQKQTSEHVQSMSALPPKVGRWLPIPSQLSVLGGVVLLRTDAPKFCNESSF